MGVECELQCNSAHSTRSSTAAHGTVLHAYTFMRDVACECSALSTRVILLACDITVKLLTMHLLFVQAAVDRTLLSMKIVASSPIA
jgi:hypothetical protein